MLFVTLSAAAAAAADAAAVFVQPRTTPSNYLRELVRSVSPAGRGSEYDHQYPSSLLLSLCLFFTVFVLLSNGSCSLALNSSWTLHGAPGGMFAVGIGGVHHNDDDSNGGLGQGGQGGQYRQGIAATRLRGEYEDLGRPAAPLALKALGASVGGTIARMFQKDTHT